MIHVTTGLLNYQIVSQMVTSMWLCAGCVTFMKSDTVDKWWSRYDNTACCVEESILVLISRFSNGVCVSVCREGKDTEWGGKQRWVPVSHASISSFMSIFVSIIIFSFYYEWMDNISSPFSDSCQHMHITNRMWRVPGWSKCTQIQAEDKSAQIVTYSM